MLGIVTGNYHNDYFLRLKEEYIISLDPPPPTPSLGPIELLPRELYPKGPKPREPMPMGPQPRELQPR